MPADYQQIRNENISRYGWDTSVLDLLGQLYSERTHFIFELIQNAEDAGATGLAFELHPDRLELWHDGRPFTEADVRGLCGVGRSRKSGDLTSIGQFGIGFKSVYAYTRSPHVYSGDEHFRVDSYVRPHAVGRRPGDGTRFVFPFDHDQVPAGVAADEIGAALAGLEPGILLFLASIARLRVDGTGVTASVLSRRAEALRGSCRRVVVAKGRQEQEWLVWHRSVGGPGGRVSGQAQVAGASESELLRGEPLRVQLAFRAEAGRIVRLERAPLNVFFPTEKETFLGFIVQGPYRTTPARDNVPEHDPANQALVRETAALLGEVLTELRADGRLTVAALTALPVQAERFGPGSMFRPLFETVREALRREALVPVAGGGYRTAGEVRLAADAELADLLDPGQLGAWFADTSISEADTAALWRFLRDEAGMAELTAGDFVSQLSAEFLSAQADEWIVRLYSFLYRRSAWWPVARARPVIRLEDGSQVVPLDSGGRPAVYLPGAAPSSLPTVRRAVAGDASARPFLEALGLAEPDVVAEVLQMVLPRYVGLELAQLEVAQHDADLELVLTALEVAAAGRREELLGRVRETAFLIGENAATGEQRLWPPPTVYQRSKELETYFAGNPEAWFAADRYGPWLAQLRGMGVRPVVEVTARTPDAAGYVLITVEFGRNERGLGGFDPAARIDGLDFALAHPGHARSEYVWNVLLAPNRRLVAGVVERSVLASYGNSTMENTRSAIAEVAAREAWLPGPDGTFRRPEELSVEDLPPTYIRDEGLAQALGMRQPVVAEAARQLGVPAMVLWGLSERPDLVAMIERELGRAGDGL